jgi:catechol 2,3-dioxygenase-like lactoylglutathione lyase family enzyme
MHIDHIQMAMPAGRESDAIGFYVDVLGLKEIAKPAELALRGGCWFQTGNMQLHLGIDPDFQPAKKAHAALRTDDLAGLRSQLEVLRFEIFDASDIDSCARFYSHDPFGNRIEFISELIER